VRPTSRWLTRSCGVTETDRVKVAVLGDDVQDAVPHLGNALRGRLPEQALDGVREAATGFKIPALKHPCAAHRPGRVARNIRGRLERGCWSGGPAADNRSRRIVQYKESARGPGRNEYGAFP
jgi:hypothetical protein